MAVEVCRIGNFGSTTDNGTTNCSLPNVYWKFSTAVTVGTLAAFLSYAFFTIIILMPVNGFFPYCFKCGNDDDTYSCCCGNNDDICSCCGNIDCVVCNACSNAHNNAFKNGTLSPFSDSNESSKMSAAETICFFINYVIVWLLYICSFGSSIWFAFAAYYTNNDHQPLYNLDSCWISKLNVTKIILHIFAAFCAIHSCFIFSKIVNKVTNKLNKLARDMDHVDFAEVTDIEQEINDMKIIELLESNDKEKINRARFYWLQKMDKDFIKEVKPTLDLLGVWFLVHWVMYALTTVLLTAFVLENILDIARIRINSIDHLMPNPNIELPYILYLVFFTLIHAYLFLYPCFQAASIAAARTKFINTIYNQQWNNIPLGIENNFINYLKTQNSECPCSVPTSPLNSTGLCSIDLGYLWYLPRIPVLKP